ncbi:MAG: hypothetical protein DWI03_01120 [Planctomycetota bacterium]|jgi:hypothetical protein|nr:MAG: hypothetical protein DWI03_01120 [Planctomycetota bacterium]
MATVRLCEGLTRRIGCAAVVVSACFAGGCKSGTWGAKPSWWTFGGSGQDPAKLASAPAYEGSIPKPSANAKPYPTTTTPDGYVLGEQQRAGQSAATGAAPSTIEPTTVTYGTKSATESATAATPSPAAAPGLSAVAPQVGPYGSLPGEPQQPSMAAIPQPASQPAAFAPDSPPMPPAGGQGFATAPAAGPTARVADARAADNWPATTPPADSRYGATSGSRFSGASLAPPPADVPAAPPLSTPPSAAPPVQVPAAVPPPLDSAPVAPPASQPLPAAPGSRRTDPGYRPGGTSSYRPSRAILAGDAPAGDSAVQPASFQTSVDQAP